MMPSRLQPDGRRLDVLQVGNQQEAQQVLGQVLGEGRDLGGAHARQRGRCGAQLGADLLEGGDYGGDLADELGAGRDDSRLVAVLDVRSQLGEQTGQRAGCLGPGGQCPGEPALVQQFGRKLQAEISKEWRSPG
jgi:hypothetical protein